TAFRGRLRLLQLHPAMLRKKIFRVYQFDTVSLSEFLSAAPDQHHMLRFPHYGTRQDDRIADMFDAGDRAGAQGFSIHDRGIHFVCASVGKDRAFAGIEMWIILQHSDRSFDCIEARSAAVQNFTTGAESMLDSSAIFLLAFRSHFAALDRAGSAMDRECDSKGVLFHCWRIFLDRRS